MPDITLDLRTARDNRFTVFFNTLSDELRGSEAEVAALRFLAQRFFNAGFEFALDATRMRLIDVVTEIQHVQEK